MTERGPLLEASNLGQIIGRARYGVLERRPRPELADAAEQARMAERGRRELEAESARQQEAARRAQHAERKKAERQAERAERQRRAVERAARPATSGKKIAKRGRPTPRGARSRVRSKRDVEKGGEYGRYVYRLKHITPQE